MPMLTPAEHDLLLAQQLERQLMREVEGRLATQLVADHWPTILLNVDPEHPIARCGKCQAPYPCPEVRWAEKRRAVPVTATVYVVSNGHQPDEEGPE